MFRVSSLLLLIIASLNKKATAQCNIQFIRHPPTNLGCNPFDTAISTPVWRLRTLCIAERISGSTSFDVNWFQRKTTREIINHGRPEIWTNSDTREEVYFGNQMINDPFNENMLGEYWCQVIDTSQQPHVMLGISDILVIEEPNSYTESRCTTVQSVIKTTCADQPPNSTSSVTSTTTTPILFATSTVTTPISSATTSTTTTSIMTVSVSIPTAIVSTSTVEQIIATTTITQPLISTLLLHTSQELISSIQLLTSQTPSSSVVVATSTTNGLNTVVGVYSTGSDSSSDKATNTITESLISTTLLGSDTIQSTMDTTNILTSSPTNQPGNQPDNDLLLTISIVAIVMLILIIILLSVIAILIYTKPQRKKVIKRTDGQFYQESIVRSSEHKLLKSGTVNESNSPQQSHPVDHRYSTISGNFEQRIPVAAPSADHHIYDGIISNSNLNKPPPPSTLPPPKQHPNMYDEYDIFHTEYHKLTSHVPQPPPIKIKNINNANANTKSTSKANSPDNVTTTESHWKYKLNPTYMQPLPGMENGFFV